MRPDYKSWIPVNFIIIPLLSTIILFGVLLYLCTGAVLSGAYLYWAAGICSILCFFQVRSSSGPYWPAVHFPITAAGS